MTDPLAPVLAVLDRVEAQGRTLRFWLRDDDAVTPTPALERLLDLTAHHGVPLTLAVIPEGTGAALARRLDEAGGVTVALHGWSHRNHAPAGAKKQELGHRDPAAILAELAEGLARLRRLHGDRLVPLLVPPWNRIDKDLLPRLPQLGLDAVSVFGPEDRGPVPQVNTHVDPVDWHGGRGCRPLPDIAADLARRVERIGADGGALGLLTHHLVHDDALWHLLDRLLALTARHPACRWCRVTELMPDQRSTT